MGTSPEGCDLHETSTERDGAPVPTSLLVIFNITQRGPSIPCTDPELSTTLVDGPTVMPLLLRHSPSVMADPPPTARPHPVAHRHGTAGTSDTSIAVLTFVPDGWVRGRAPEGPFSGSQDLALAATRTPKNDPSRDPPKTPPDPPKTKHTLNQDR